MKKCKKFIAFVCIFAMLFSMVGYTDAAPAKGNDITGHWAAKDLTEWLAKGYITADATGLVNPNSVITRAEFANYVNKAFKFTEKATVNFTDVKSTDTFADDVAKAVKAGYMVGNSDGTWKPNAAITRQEVAVLLARLLELEDTSNGFAFAGFGDKAKVSTWATNSVIAVSAKGYMAGDGKNFNPLSNVTRAEAVTLLTRANGDYYAFIIKTSGTVNATKLDGSVYVKANNVEMKGTEVTGNLVIGKEIGDGNFTLRDSVVKGNIVINGGGVNSIHLINVVTGNVIVQRTNGNVRVSLEGTSNIANLSVLTPASLQLAAQSRIAALVLNSPAAITGTGTIASTVINTTGVTSTITLPNVTGSVGSKGVKPPVDTPAAPSTGGSAGSGGGSDGGGSGGGSSTIYVTSITVSATGGATTVVNSGTLQMLAVVAPTNATNKAVTWSVTNGTGTALIDASTGFLQATGVGTVTVKATNAVSGVYGTKGIIITPAPVVVNKATLINAISAASANAGTVTESVYGTDVAVGTYWVTTEVKTAYTNAIATAQLVADDADATQGEVDDVVTALGTATGTFNTAKAEGTMPAPIIDVTLQNAIISVADKIVICIYQSIGGVDSEIPSLVADDFTLTKDFSGVATIISGFTLAPSVGTWEYSIQPQSGQTFVAGNYRLAFNKAGYSLEHIDFVVAASANAANAATVATVKGLVAGATYEMAQAAATNEAAVKTAIESVISGLALDGVKTTVKKVDYTEAVAGTAGTPDGTNGTYTFTVELSKGADATLATDTTATLTMIITATVYITPNQDQAAPTGLAGVAPTSAANNDGKITGTTTAMEYKLATGGTYTACTATETTVAAGDYVVRFAAKTGYNAGATAAVTVPAYVAPATLSSIAIKTAATKVVYTVGDTLDITGLVIEGTYSDGSKKDETITAANITGFDSTSVVASQTLTVTVGGKITTYTVEIKAADKSDATITVSNATPVKGISFLVFINNAKGADGLALSGSISVTVTSNDISEGDAGVLSNGTINYSGAGDNGIIVTLKNTGVQTITVKIDGVAHPKTVNVTVMTQEDANLFGAANTAVAALEAKAADNLTVEGNLTAAEALVKPAQDAVAAADRIIGIDAIRNRLTAAVGTVTAARTAFDAVPPLLRAADIAVAALEVKASADLTAEGCLKEAKDAVVSAKGAVAAAAGITGIDAIKIRLAAAEIVVDKALVEAARLAMESTTSMMDQSSVTGEAGALELLEMVMSQFVYRWEVETKVNMVSYTAAVAGTPGTPGGTNGKCEFTVDLSRGAAAYTTKTLVATIYATEYTAPTNAANAATVATVKGLVAGATYEMTQAAATNEAAVKTAIESVISGLALDGVTTTVTKVDYTEAVAGTAGTPDGTNGTYTFTVELSKGADATLATDTTATLTMIITATVYIAPANESLISNTITNFNYETVYATQARLVSKAITTSDFGPGKNRSFTITDGAGNNISVNLNWNIPLNEYVTTYAAAVGSAVDSVIQDYFNQNGGLMNRTLHASSDGEQFYIGTFATGTNSSITISGTDASYFFDTLQANGTNDDTLPNRTFTIHDGTNTVTITLDYSYVDMSDLVNNINYMLSQSQVSATVEKVDESHFRLVTKTPGIHLTIDGANKTDFFDIFESQAKVTSITVSSAGGANTVMDGSTLQMSATVAPTNATNKTVIWSAEPLAGGAATIDENGLLTATGAGTVTVKATAKDGSGVAGTQAITIVPPTPIAASISNVTATNGTVTITLEAKPTVAVVADDFSATIDIDGAGANPLTLAGFNYDGNVTITYTFAAVAQTASEQSVVVTVKLAGKETAANAFTVEVISAQQIAINAINEAAGDYTKSKNISLETINTAIARTNAIAANVNTYRSQIASRFKQIGGAYTADTIWDLVNTENTNKAKDALVALGSAGIICENPNASPLVTFLKPAALTDGTGITFQISYEYGSNVNVIPQYSNGNLVIDRKGGGSIKIDVNVKSASDWGLLVHYLVTVPAGTDNVTWVLDN